MAHCCKSLCRHHQTDRGIPYLVHVSEQAQDPLRFLLSLSSTIEPFRLLI